MLNSALSGTITELAWVFWLVVSIWVFVCLFIWF